MEFSVMCNLYYVETPVFLVLSCLPQYGQALLDINLIKTSPILEFDLDLNFTRLKDVYFVHEQS